ncbi:TonB-dependent receptor [Methylobacter sp.]|uniref:TonB-dependent receptor domain-containing protein n=1 Tax=Methylobacter sp. TaxID=2051955 RepID=UPI0025E1CCE6|nr:TonB-dependent receptor [Methylobacter sp.]
MRKKVNKLGTSPKGGFDSKRAIKNCLVGGVFVGMLVQVMPALSADKDKKIHFNIPANDLATALFAYSETTGIQLSYPQKMVSGIKSPSVSGDYTPEQALQKLLAGSNIAHQYVDDDAVMLTEVPKQSNTGGTITLNPMTIESTASSESPSLTTPSIAESKAKLNRVPGGTTVIDGERIKEGAVLTVRDALTNAPGVYVGEATAGAAGPSRISIRGSDVNSTVGGPLRGLKILRNGMPFTRANGAFDTQTINLYAIDHIDVYRGASALEYGGSNLGGALNFITPTGYTADPLKIGMTWGTNGHVNPTVSAARVFDNGFDVYGAFSYLDTNTTRENNEQEQFQGHGNIGYRWNEDQETRLYFDVQENDFLAATALTKQQIDTNPRQNQNSFSLGNGIKVYRSDLKHSVKLDNGDRFDVGAYYFNTQFKFDFTGGTNRDLWEDTGFNWRHEINGKLFDLQNRVVWGGFTQWMFSNDTNYATVNRHRGPLLNAEHDRWVNVEGYLEDQLSLTDTFTLVGGVQLNYRNVNYVRYEGYVASAARPSNEADKDFFNANPKLGFTWQATKEAQIYGNLSRSSEPPPLSDLANIFVTPALDSQTASTVEIGTRGQSDWLKWDLAFYQAWLNNEYLIIPLPPFGSGNFTATNANSTTLHSGIELGLETTVPLNVVSSGDQIRFSGNYTWNNFHLDNDQTLGDNRLPAIPEHNARFEAVYQHPSGFYIGPNVQAVSSNWVDFANTLAAKPYALLGARVGWDDKKHWKVFVDGRNLTNEHYASAVAVMGNANGLDAAQFNPGATRQVFGGFEYRY